MIEQPEGEGESIQSAMNMVRACLFGNSSTLSGAIKDEPTRLLIADKINRLDSAVDAQIEELTRERDEARRNERPLCTCDPGNFGSAPYPPEPDPNCPCHAELIEAQMDAFSARRLISSTVKWCEEEAERWETNDFNPSAQSALRSCAAKLQGEA